MRKLSVVVLITMILVGVVFIIIDSRRPVQQHSITGIGVALAVRHRALMIMGVLPVTPAARAGLHRGLIIQQIDGTNVVGKSLTECVAMTRGPVGSKVRLEVVGPAGTNIVEFTREKISVPVGHGTRRIVPVPH